MIEYVDQANLRFSASAPEAMNKVVVKIDEIIDAINILQAQVKNLREKGKANGSP